MELLNTIRLLIALVALVSLGVQSDTQCNLKIDLTQDLSHTLDIRDKGECWYLFEAPADYGLKVEFKNLKIHNSDCPDGECCGDHIKIGEGSLIGENLHQTYCGWTIVEPFVFNTHNIWLQYKIDNTEMLGGVVVEISAFRLVFRNETHGLIKSESNYFNNMNLMYKIMAPEDYLVKFNLLNTFSMEKVGKKCLDYLEIGQLNDVDSIPRFFCGDIVTPVQFTLPTNETYVKLFTDESELGAGFELEFMPVKYIFRQPHGLIQSPKKPMNITYQIVAPAGKKIELTLKAYNFFPCRMQEAESTSSHRTLLNQDCKLNHHLLVIY